MALAAALRNSDMLTRLPPTCGTARAKSRSVHSGLSLSALAEELPVERFLAVIGVPHRNDAPRIIARRPNYTHQTIAQQAEGPYAPLAIVPAVIRRVEGRPGEHL